MLGHQWARDFYNNWVDASNEEPRKYKRYFCDCPERHKLKLVKPSGMKEKRRFAPYFAHVTKALRGTVTCPGGESVVHRNAKQVLRERMGDYIFLLSECRRCHLREWEDGEGAEVRIETVSSDGKWRYDCTLVRGGRTVMALEVYHKHRTSLEKIESTRGDGLRIAEFLASDILSMKKGGCCHLNNLCVDNCYCSRCLKEEIHKGLELQWEEELEAVIHLEQVIDDAWGHRGTIFQYEKEMSSLSMLEKSALILSILSNYSSIEFYRTDTWKRTFDMRGIYFDVKMHGIEIRYHRIHSEPFFLGIVNYVDEYVIKKIMKEALSRFSISDIWIVRFAHIRQCYESWKYTGGERVSVCLRDQKFSILRSLESITFRCAGCYGKGHSYDDCRETNRCSRCGRTGHRKSHCFAKRDIGGNRLANNGDNESRRKFKKK